MDIIEFLDRTTNRNIKNNVEFMFQQRLQERNRELACRRRELRTILECENLVYDEELALLMRERVKENERKRLEWIGMHRLEREKAEQELLALKKLQRELENCEEIRHLQSKQNVMETKQAQLYQIEEKKVLRQREKRIEHLWLEAMRSYSAEKEKQERLEQTLQKLIAETNQTQNQNQYQEAKTKSEKDTALWWQHHAEEDTRAKMMELESRDAEMIRQQFQKQQQGILLKHQIHENEYNRHLELKKRLDEEERLLFLEKAQIRDDSSRNLNAKLRNREWHKGYLQHSIDEKRSIRALQQQRQQEMLTVQGVCVLQQKPKQPYGKQTR